MNKEEFIKELKKLNIELNNDTLAKLDEYYNILNEENKKYNLTRIITKEEVYLKHFYDSLTITKIINIKDQSICDLGSGAGIPRTSSSYMLSIYQYNFDRVKWKKMLLSKFSKRKIKFIKCYCFKY